MRQSEKTPGFVEKNSWLLYHDNAPAYTSLIVSEYLPQNNTVMMPYSQNSPCDFFLFPKIKRTLKNCHFTTIKDIKAHC